MKKGQLGQLKEVLDSLSKYVPFKVGRNLSFINSHLQEIEIEKNTIIKSLSSSDTEEWCYNLVNKKLIPILKDNKPILRKELFALTDEEKSELLKQNNRILFSTVLPENADQYVQYIDDLSNTEIDVEIRKIKFTYAELDRVCNTIVNSNNSKLQADIAYHIQFLDSISYIESEE